MPGAVRDLLPQPGERGLASADPAGVARTLDSAWAGLLDVAEQVDLDAGSRLPGWSARDVLVHLGSWDGHSDVTDLVEDARAARVTSVDDREARNARLVSEHHDATRDEILAALEDARSRAVDFLTGPDAEPLGQRWAPSVVGDLPLTGLLVAQAFELAVHALDLVPAGASEPSRELLDAGVGAVVDVTGAIAARRRVDVCLAVRTPEGSWVTGASDGAWTTVHLGAGRPARELPWPGVSGAAADVLDAASGRSLAAQQVLTRRLRLHDVPALVRLLPLLEAAPGLPGGSALQTSWRMLGGMGRLAGRVGGGVASALGGR